MPEARQKKWLRETESGSRRWNGEVNLERYWLTQQHTIGTQSRLRRNEEGGEEPGPDSSSCSC
ncbi:MAG: hypothetical protein ACOYMN_13295 [Roseimicrobium sp.]